jgi:hypothetical protein
VACRRFTALHTLLVAQAAIEAQEEHMMTRIALKALIVALAAVPVHAQ